MKKRQFLRKIKFEKAPLKEIKSDIDNPGRGWYRIYSFDAEIGYPKDEWPWCLSKEEQLAILVIDLSAYSASDIDENALKNIYEAFSFFEENQKELIIRFVYDTEGKALLSEPANIKTVMKHMTAVAPVVNVFKKIIFCIQGLFVGNWGELHGSKFSDNVSLKKLSAHWNKLIDEDIFLAVRTPKQHREVGGGKRMGLFNDGMLGSETDLGTYSLSNISWELDFVDKLMKKVPIGGEVIGNSPIANIDSAVNRLRKTHVSYLNSVYDEQVLSRWKNTLYEGVNGFEYVGMHLGYRFVVTDAVLSEKGLEIEIENKGFANFYEDNRVEVIIVDELNNRKAVETKSDMRDWEVGKKTKVLADIAMDVCEEANIYFNAYRKKDGKLIKFANEYTKEGLLIGKINPLNGEYYEK